MALGAVSSVMTASSTICPPNWRHGARAELFPVGGAALAVAYDATRATRDLDAVFIPTDVVRRSAAAVAENRGLAQDWLNDAVKGFLPGPDPDAQRFYSSDSLIVDVASPRYLLAMKLFAARAEIDAGPGPACREEQHLTTAAHEASGSDVTALRPATG